MADQAEQHQKWWEQIKKHRVAIGVGAIVFVVVIVFIFASYWFAGYWFGWTGFNGDTIIWQPTTMNCTPLPICLEEQQPAKTLWDWLGLLGVLAIPVVVGFGVAWFTAQQGKVSERENKDSQREKALQDYIDKMSELILKECLGESPSNPQVQIIAQARTATVLRILNPERIASLIRFLSQAGILETCT